MPIDRRAVLDRLKSFDFPGLFTQELGWDWFNRTEEITKDGQTFRLAGVAEKRGVQVFHCLPDADSRIPASTMRFALERELTKRAREHLLSRRRPMTVAPFTQGALHLVSSGRATSVEALIHLGHKSAQGCPAVQHPATVRPWRAGGQLREHWQRGSFQWSLLIRVNSLIVRSYARVSA
jgi:hypothetical protein